MWFHVSNLIRVWDLPTRVFHWALVVGVVGLVTTAEIGGAAMDWHFRCGYAVLGLLLFRMVWGLVGGKWSRFSSFIYSPSTVLRYLRGQGIPEHSIGHNPLGSISVFALLAFLMMQVASGLLSDDEIAAAGPMVKFASSALVKAATFYHTEVGKLCLLGLLSLHIGAILFYRFRKGENLVIPMIKGDKASSFTIAGSRDDTKSRLLALVILAGCAALVAWMLRQAR
jgi:cytochrome b